MTDEKDPKDDKWVMPKPVFRSSSGSLPKSLEETIHESNFPSSETIEISAETKKIEEDDDILSILEENASAITVESVDLDGEITISSLPTLVMETLSEPELAQEPTQASEPESPAESPVAAEPEALPDTEPDIHIVAEAEVPAVEPEAPVVVTAKNTPVKPKAKKRGAGSFLTIFIFIALLAAALIYGLYYYLSEYRSGGSGPF